MSIKAMDMSLDDIIRSNKRSGGQDGNFKGRGGSNSGPGPDRRFANRNPNRPMPYTTRQTAMQPMQVPELMWQQQMVLSGGFDPEAGTKLYISNLDYGVSNEDIQVLFSEAGDLTRYSIHYDRSGRSKGTAEVVFLRQTDALAAIKRYNNVQLDGKPMKIELVGVNLSTPAHVPPTTNSILGKPNFAFRGGQGRVNVREWGHSGRGRGFGRGSGQGRGHQKLSVADLDADLEKYKMEASKLK